MTAIDDAQYQRVISASPIAAKYATPINRESAHEILQKKLEASAAETEAAAEAESQQESDDFAWRQGGAAPRRTAAPRRAAKRPPKSFVEEALGSRMAQNVARQATRTVTKEVTRGVMGILKRLF